MNLRIAQFVRPGAISEGGECEGLFSHGLHGLKQDLHGFRQWVKKPLVPESSLGSRPLRFMPPCEWTCPEELSECPIERCRGRKAGLGSSPAQCALFSTNL